MRRTLVLIALGLVLGGSFALGYRISQESRAASSAGAPRVVDEVREALAQRYYRPVSSSVLHLDSIGEMLSALGDPYTAYLEPTDYRLLRQQTASRYSGIGVSVLPSAHGLVVVALRPGPAQRAGIEEGDTIVRIGATPTLRLGMPTAFARILGPPGTTVRLELLRGSRHLDLDVRREMISAPVVDARLLSFAGARWGVLHLNAFRVGSAVVLRRQIRLLQREGASGLVLDLRQNPGGLFDQAVAVSSLFLDRGVVVSLSGAHSPHRVYRAFPGLATHLPLVVLVDRATASSAEIVAAALRDNQRATLVGERTFGKALVQSVDPLDNGAALELTIARYYTPSGQDISRVGVVPQIHAVDDPATPRDEALDVALRVLARPTS
ncbi:MAG TPA: S41 family peptidase [Gaiellaceae bacterium]|jgi:carboxyl-terminal processing protease|nr:S41 family peptidase [Gaiellaceae bacterium]